MVVLQTFLNGLETNWCYARTVAALKSEPAVLTPSDTFRFERGESADDWNASLFLKYENQLFSPSRLAHCFVMHDVCVLGCGFMLFTAEGAFISETRYLAKNLPARVASSMRQREMKTAPEDITWIISSNASMYNYWHWTAQALPAIMHCRAFLLRNGIIKCGLITPRLRPYQLQCLSLLGLADLPRLEIKHTETYRVASVVYSQLLAGGRAFAPSTYRKAVREGLIFGAGERPSQAGQRICVSRTDSRRRPMSNAGDLEAALVRKKGFHVIVPGSLSVEEQIRVFNQADVVVAPHGAGSTNYLFCRPETRVLELGQASYINAAPGSLCRTAGSTLRLDLFRDDGRGQQTEGWQVDVDICLKTISHMV